jgi:hypothetical protein
MTPKYFLIKGQIFISLLSNGYRKMKREEGKEADW